MKLSEVFQFVIMGLIMLGLFATMAQNSYGFTLTGLSCFGLALLYLVQFIVKLLDNFSGLEKSILPGISELLLLSALIMLFGFRALYIRLPHSDLIFITLCIFLLVVYFLIGSASYIMAKKENSGLAGILLFFYSSILIFIASLSARIINPGMSELIGMLGAITAFPVIISIIRQKPYDYSGKSITLFHFIYASGNKSGILFHFFVLSVIYLGLLHFRIVPAIENTDKPRAYIELINQAETGKEKPVNGKYRHEIYKEAMDKFLSRHGKKE
jgi:hypothetical protein